MNNIERYEAFNTELREILTLYEEVYFRNDGTYNINSMPSQVGQSRGTKTYELFEENPSALFVVFAEFCPKNDEELGRVKIHYDIKYGGTKDFSPSGLTDLRGLNNLLDKYNMEMEWENNSIFLIYDAIDELALLI